MDHDETPRPAADHGDIADEGAWIEELSDSSRVAVDAADRERARRFADMAAEEATLAGTLVDLVEHHAPVTLVTRYDRGLVGRLDAMGKDFVRLRLDDGRLAFVRITALAGVIPHVALDRAGGERVPPTDLTLVELLRLRVDDRPDLVLYRGGARPATGTLVAVGRDVVTLRGESGVEFCPIAAVSEIVTRDAG